jgi:1,4-alpha-glucan branching enzyme
MWMNDLVAWTWPVIWDAEDRFWELAPRAVDTPMLDPIVAQAARALLLLQSSDWQFIISTGEVDDYAIRRFNGHAADVRALLDALQDGLSELDVSGGLGLAREMQARDDVFRDIMPAIRDVVAARVAMPARRDS